MNGKRNIMTDFSKYSDDEINQAIGKAMNSPIDNFYTRSYFFCLNQLIFKKLEFIPLENSFEVRTYGQDGKPIIAQNKNPRRAICECYLMLKEGEG